MRSIPPEETLARMAPVLRQVGITRVANQTGLDHLGIPVFAAFRPNSRSLAAHQGKGLSAAAARASAVMEGAECYLAETCRLPLLLARPGELEDAVDVDRLPRLRRGEAQPGEGGGDARLLWATGRDLVSGRCRQVPYEMVHADFTTPQPPLSFRFPANTNGLASGNTAEEAMLHALFEVIERDAVALWRLGPASRGVVAPDSVDDPACRALLLRLREAEVAADIWDLGSATGLPAYLCLLTPPDDGMAGIEPEIGSGCHWHAGVALARAVTEAAQARVTRIAGARDDYAPSSYAGAARRQRREQAERWHRGAAGVQGVAFRGGGAAGSGPSWLLDAVLGGLARRGCEAAVWVDLSRPELPFHGGRIVVPGLAGPG